MKKQGLGFLGFAYLQTIDRISGDGVNQEFDTKRFGELKSETK